MYITYCTTYDPGTYEDIKYIGDQDVNVDSVEQLIALLTAFKETHPNAQPQAYQGECESVIVASQGDFRYAMIIHSGRAAE